MKIPSVKTVIESIQVIDKEFELFNYIVEKINETPLDNDGEIASGRFDFEVPTTDENLLFMVIGRLKKHGYTERETGQYVCKYIDLYVDIEAYLGGDKVDFVYNKKDLEELVKHAIENEI